MGAAQGASLSVAALDGADDSAGVLQTKPASSQVPAVPQVRPLKGCVQVETAMKLLHYICQSRPLQAWQQSDYTSSPTGIISVAWASMKGVAARLCCSQLLAAPACRFGADSALTQALLTSAAVERRGKHRHYRQRHSPSTRRQPPRHPMAPTLPPPLTSQHLIATRWARPAGCGGKAPPARWARSLMCSRQRCRKIR